MSFLFSCGKLTEQVFRQLLKAFIAVHNSGDLFV
jgi:hypothetical protein